MRGPKLTIEITDNKTVLATWVNERDILNKYETLAERTHHITYSLTNKKKRDRFIKLIRCHFFGERHPDRKEPDDDDK